MTKSVSGIHIGEDTITVVDLTLSGRAVTVTRFAESRRAGEEVAQVLAELAGHGAASKRHVYTGLSGDRVLRREAVFPFSDKRRIARTLTFSLADTLPFPVNEAALSYYLMAGGENKTKVIAFLAQKKKMEEFRQSFSDAGLTLKAISLESAAIAALIGGSTKGGDALLSLHLGRDRSLISLIAEGKVLMTRMLNLKMTDLLPGMAERLNITLLEAESLLFAGVNDPQRGDLNAVLGDLLERLVKEVVLSLRSFDIDERGIDKIVLSGEGAHIGGLSRALETGTGLKAVEAEVGENLTTGPKVNREDLLKKGFVALGYALMGAEGAPLNFIRGESPLFTSPLFKQLYGQRKLLAMAAAIIVVLYTASLLVDVRFQKNRYLGIKNQITEIFTSTLPGVKRIVNEEHQLRTALVALEEKVSLFSDDSSPKMVDLLREISRMSPPNVTFNITRMRVGKDGLKISAETANFDGVEKIKQNLKKGALFSQVDVGGAKTSKLQNVVEFQLNIKLHP